jgi:type VI secretion system protein VasD
MLRACLLPLLSVAVACVGSAPAASPAAAPAPCPALPLTLALSASPRSNALASNEGRPVQVRIYQLRSDARLRASSFEDVWQNDAKALEGDLVSSEQHTLFPNSTQSIALTPKPDGAYLGLVALFREPQGKDWLLTYEIAPPKSRPPCATKADPIAVWLDRMQIQDGAGHETDQETPSAGGEALGNSESEAH